MKKEKVYNIQTIADLVEVASKENIDFLLRDLDAFVRLVVDVKDMPGFIRMARADVFKWVDDGKNDIKITLKVEGAQK